MKPENKYLLEEQTKELETAAELAAYLEFRKAHDEWVEPFINECGVVGVENDPLFISSYCTDIKIKKNGYTQDLGDIDSLDADVQHCIQNTGIFLVFPRKNKLEVWPTRHTAYLSICERADDSCGTMTRFRNKVNKKVLPTVEKAERLTRDFLLYSDKCKILLRDGMVGCMLSKQYKILPSDKLLSTLERQLKADHPEYSFSTAKISHDYLIVEYNLNNLEAEETFRMKLNAAGAAIQEVKAGVRFSTSDTGNSKVYTQFFYCVDGRKMNLGKPLEMAHIGDSSIEKYALILEGMGEILKEQEEKIEYLGNLDIQNVPACLKKIVEAYDPLFSKTAANEVIAEAELLGMAGSAVDIYLALNDIIERMRLRSNMDAFSFIQLSEKVARMIDLNYAAIDNGAPVQKV